MRSTRRKFLTQSAALGATATAALLPGSIRRALAIPASTVTGTIMDVQHVVILMQENRSFDHYLGTLAGVRGFNDRSTLPIYGQPSIFHQPTGKIGHATPYHFDSKVSSALSAPSLAHAWQDQHAAWNHGLWDNWVPAKGGYTMGYYTRADIPFHYALADAFTVCDAYHCSVMSCTNPNRLHLMSGMLDVSATAGGPILTNSPINDPPCGWNTVPELLQSAGISWQVYQGVDGHEPFKTAASDNPSFMNMMRHFPVMATAPAGSTLQQRSVALRTYSQFVSDVQKGTLAQVSWLCPPEACCEHPQWTPSDGATYIGAILDALTANRTLWSKTVLLIMYDENDGYFDHMPGPTPPTNPGDGASNIDTTGEIVRDVSGYANGPVGLGARVPMVVVSPWSKGPWTCSQVFDHTSIIQFLEKRFGIHCANISAWRRAVCGDLTAAFDFTSPNTAITVPSTAGLSASAASARSLPPPNPPPPTLQAELPRQEKGSRNARALPYALLAHATDNASTRSVAINFRNDGKAAAVYQVFSAPISFAVKRYTVAAGTTLIANWDWAPSTSHEALAYDLTVIGPNGFLRRMTSSGAFKAKVSATLHYAAAPGDVTIRLDNGDAVARTFTIVDNRYGLAPMEVSVPAGKTIEKSWSLADSSHWYDLSITVDDDKLYLRRFAGHVETGAPGVTDPSMS